MFLAANFLSALAEVVNIILTIYMWVIIARALISWVSPDPWNPIVRLLDQLTEPVLDPIRRRLGMGMGLDLSPIIAILIIIFLQAVVVHSLHDLAVRMR